MSVRLRLRREGTKKKPHFRVVAADQRSPRDGRFIEILGEYHPAEDPSRIEIDNERALYWLRNGAQPSNTVKKLLRISGAWEEFKPGDEPKRVRHPEEAEKAKKQAEAAEAAEEEAAKAEEEPDEEPAPEEETAQDAGDSDDETDRDEDEDEDSAGDAQEGAAAAPEEEVEAGDESTPEDDTAAPAAETEDVGDDAAGSPGEDIEEEASK